MCHNAALVSPGRTRLALLASAALVAGTPAAASAQTDAPTASASATGITVDAKTGKTVPLLREVIVTGQLTNPGANENVQISVRASGRDLSSEKVTAKADGSFEYRFKVEACCEYTVTAENANKRATDTFKTDVPKSLRKGPIAAAYNQALQSQGFHTGTKGARVTSGTRLATKAFRKVNGMRRSERYRPSIFRTLLQGRGGFNVRYPDSGRHVEVDIGEQTMSLIQGDTPVHTFHVSTGTGGTPTVRGKFRFYRKEPGTNASRDVLLGLLHPRLCHTRLQVRAELQREPRLRQEPSRVLALHLQLDRHRGPDPRVRLSTSRR